MKTILTKITRYDLTLALGLILLSIILFAQKISSPAGGLAEIYINNKLTDRIRLSEDKVYCYDVPLGQIIVSVEQGKIRVAQSHCPLHLCVKQGAINKQGEIIVCLPNRFMIVVSKGKLTELDGVVG
jgi:hypothetical protein